MRLRGWSRPIFWGFGGERARARAAISEPLESYRVLNPIEDSTICSTERHVIKHTATPPHLPFALW